MKSFLHSLFVPQDFRQFLRFLVVGCTNFAVSFTVYLLCYKYWELASLPFDRSVNIGSQHYVIMDGITIASFKAAFANIVGYACGIINSFIWNKLWTFKIRYETTKQLTRFIILNIMCLTLSTAIIFIFVDILSSPHKITWIVTMGIITILNFIGSKYWVFKQPSLSI